jgi:diguanylate cyclase (GGDEF)-like protein
MQNKVLVIEDSPTSMKILKRLIGKARLTTVCATSLTEAKQIVANSLPEEYLCAIVDYTLPDATNGEAIDFIIGSFFPTVVVTGQLDEAIRSNVLSKEVVDYIPKENAQVYDYLSRLLERLEKNKQVGVLVVDDSRVGRNKMSSLLRRHNFITYEASGAAMGLEILQQHQDIKLVITDENMPDMTGVELVAAIRNTYKKEDLGIIGVSSDKSSSLSARFIKTGANDYLTKPYCHEEFFCRIMQNVEHIENIEAIRRASNSDFLTGLPNRRHFFNRVKASMHYEPKERCLALIDLDLFKNINDTYGHDAGDQVLKTVAKLIVSHFKGCFVSRFGGEEFCIYMPDVAIEDAEIKLNIFRQQFADKLIKYDGQDINCTLSVGLTNHFMGKIENMLSAADANLYRAKEMGRNQVVIDS